MNPSEPSVLRAEAVTKIFANRRMFRFDCKHTVAAKDFDLSVTQGTIVGLIGPSGAGKTTLGRILAGLLKPDSGNVFLNDIPLYGTSANGHHNGARKSVRYIFQNVNAPLNPRMTVSAILEEPLTVHTEMTQVERLGRMEDVAREVDLPLSLLDEYPRVLSGGEKRRVGIARALMCRPVFMIADEPTAGLDEALRAGLLELLKKLRDVEGMGIMIISHDMHAIATTADEVVVIDRGRRV